jgi:hypothetical protein
MSEFQFAPPSGGGGFFAPKNHIGHALLIKQVHEIDRHFDDLKQAEVDRAKFDYVCLDCGKGDLETDALNTHPGIVGRLRRYAGTDQMILARIGQLPSKKAGFNPTFVLEDSSTDPAVIGKATTWLTGWHASQFAAPTPPAAPAAVTPPAMLNNTPIGMKTGKATAGLPDPNALALMQLGYTTEQVAGLVKDGQDLQAILELARQVGANPAA